MRVLILPIAMLIAACGSGGCSAGRSGTIPGGVAPSSLAGQSRGNCGPNPINAYLLELLRTLNETVSYKTLIIRKAESCTTFVEKVADNGSSESLRSCVTQTSDLEPSAIATLNTLVVQATQNAQNSSPQSLRAFDTCAANYIYCGRPTCCGDGIVQATEACDLGAANGAYNGSCDASCGGRGPFCGDGRRNGPEECDEGPSGGSKCASDCSHCGTWLGACCGPEQTCSGEMVCGGGRCRIGAASAFPGSVDDRMSKALDEANLVEMKLAIQDGADVNRPATFRGPAPPLIRAILREQSTLSDTLFSLKGVDPNVATYEGDTALIVAASYGRVRAARQLLAMSGLDRNKTGARDRSALHAAVEDSGAALVPDLVAAGLDINGREVDGYTVLHWAVAHGYAAGVQAVLNVPGVNVNAGYGGLAATPADLAVDRLDETLVNMIVAHGGVCRRYHRSSWKCPRAE